MPLAVRVRDGVGVLALLLMGAGASLSALRMLTGQTRANPGEALGALLLALGLLGAGGCFALRWWAAGGGDWVPLPPPPRHGLEPMELRPRRRLNSTEWLLLPVLLLTMGFSLVVAVAWSLAGLNVVSQLVWLAVGVWWLIGGLLLRGMYHRVCGPHRQGPVLRIEPRGIIDLRPPMQGWVPWEEIRHVEGVLLRSRPVLVVWFQPGAPSRQRVAARPLNWLAGQPGDWFIDLDELDGSLTAVERHARQCLAAARLPSTSLRERGRRAGSGKRPVG